MCRLVLAFRAFRSYPDTWSQPSFHLSSLSSSLYLFESAARKTTTSCRNLPSPNKEAYPDFRAIVCHPSSSYLDVSNLDFGLQLLLRHHPPLRLIFPPSTLNLQSRLSTFFTFYSKTVDWFLQFNTFYTCSRRLSGTVATAATGATTCYFAGTDLELAFTDQPPPPSNPTDCRLRTNPPVISP